MKSCSTNDVKVYNLSAGKSLPDWISDRKRRNLQKSDSGVRRRIELIQDFDMPGVSSNIKVSPDGDYILATGIYKPRLRCYDVANLSMKFERCFDSEVVKFLTLSTDYSKLVFLHVDRYIELHSQEGRYFRLRIPKFGRDLSYHGPSCEVLVGGVGSEVYRLNLELGRFMRAWETESKGVNCVEINPVHHLVLFGTEEGVVQAWDGRAGVKVGVLDVGRHVVEEGDVEVEGVPSISSLKCKDGLKMGVGVGTGQVLLYDLRSNKPLLVKDHMYGEAIKGIQFAGGGQEEEFVMSMDKKVVKIWREGTGEPWTSVEGEAEFNDVCLVKGTGMFFVANEDKKMGVYYIPGMGPAPRWCSFLDNLTEELEESDVLAVYDDYKFVTGQELEEIGLGHLVGSRLLRAYMHGYFMDMRLYRKAKTVAQPFQFDEFKKKKIQERLQAQRSSRVRLNTALPKVNKELALKFMGQEKQGQGGSKKMGVNLLHDDRFSGLFSNSDFEIDKNTPEYRLLNPVLSKMDKKGPKIESVFKAVDDEEDEEEEGVARSEEDDDMLYQNSSSDDEDDTDDGPDRTTSGISKKAKKGLREGGRGGLKKKGLGVGPKFYEIKSGEGFKPSDLNRQAKGVRGGDKLKSSLGDRLVDNDNGGGDDKERRGPLGSREMTFTMNSKRRKDFRRDAEDHHRERKGLRRSTGNLKNKKHAWKG